MKKFLVILLLSCSIRAEDVIAPVQPVEAAEVKVAQAETSLSVEAVAPTEVKPAAEVVAEPKVEVVQVAPVVTENNEEQNLNKLVTFLLRKEALREVLNQQLDQLFKTFQMKSTKAEAIEAFLVEYDSPVVLNVFKEIIKRYYTTEDIVELIKFYESPVGQKSLAVSPDLSREFSKTTIQVSQQVLARYMPVTIQSN